MHRWSHISRLLRAPLAAALLAGMVVAPLGARSAHAATGPQLTVKCFGTKVRYQVSCWTWGNSFAGGENVHLRYTVTYITMPRVNGKRPTQAFIRTVKTNSLGTLTRTPHITFSVTKVHTSFAVAVSGTGSAKDKGTTSTASLGT